VMRVAVAWRAPWLNFVESAFGIKPFSSVVSLHSGVWPPRQPPSAPLSSISIEIGVSLETG